MASQVMQKKPQQLQKSKNEIELDVFIGNAKTEPTKSFNEIALESVFSSQQQYIPPAAVQASMPLQQYFLPTTGPVGGVGAVGAVGAAGAVGPVAVGAVAGYPTSLLYPYGAPVAQPQPFLSSPQQFNAFPATQFQPFQVMQPPQPQPTQTLQPFLYQSQPVVYPSLLPTGVTSPSPLAVPHPSQPVAHSVSPSTGPELNLQQLESLFQPPTSPPPSIQFSSSLFSSQSKTVNAPSKLYPELPESPIQKETTKALTQPQPPQEDVISKRCIRCCQYYVTTKQDDCKYHAGIYKRAYSSNLIAGAAIEYWTCCKSTHKNEVGCKRGPHKEDPQMRKIFENFPQKTQINEKEGILIDFHTHQLLAAKEEVQPESPPKPPPENEKQYNAITHYVTDADTLIGLSLRYNIPAKLIRQLNKMPNDDVQGYSRLFIPKKGYDLSTIEVPPKEEEFKKVDANLGEKERALAQKRMLVRLQGQTGMTQEEADYYLKLYGYSYEEALKEYKEDMEWEKKMMGQGQTKVISRQVK